MLKRAFEAGVPCAWVVGDSLYGADHQTRRLVEAHGRGYVLAVTSAQRLGLKPVEDWLEDVPAKGWTRLSAGDGAKGPRLYDWAYLPYGLPPAGWQSGLLIRRKKGRPHQFTFYLTWAPAGTPLSHLGAGRDPSVDAGADCGPALDHRELLRGSQGRDWAGRVRGALVDGLAPAHHALHAGACVSDGGAPARRRGERRPSRTPGRCCRSPYRRCAVCSGIWCGSGRLRWRPSSIGPHGDDGTSSALRSVTGAPARGADIKPGCSTRPSGR